jgi:ABC-type transport system involved in multi-copper enzyme maturation permease subunit
MREALPARNSKRQKGISMEATAAPAPKVTFNRWLPYWAVFQADVRQTLQSWTYRLWVVGTVLATAGYLLYRFGPYHEAGLVQPASAIVSNLLRWSVLGSAAIIVVLTAGSISSERGTMADSVLSRGISRYQYFLGKWHARLALVLGTYVSLSLVSLLCAHLLMHEDLSLGGSLIALMTVAAFLSAVISLGVSVSGMANSTVLAIAVVWGLLYGGGFLVSYLPGSLPSPDKALQRLPFILQGKYDLEVLGELIGWCAAVSCVTGAIGVVYFARRDV